MAEAQADFERRAANDYYAEWFWFPYSDYAWINTWEITDDPSGAEDYPSPVSKVIQLASTLAMQVLQETAALTQTQQWFPLTRTTPICESFCDHGPEMFAPNTDPNDTARAAMINLPPYETLFGNHLETIKTWLPDALHFQRAIQNVRVRDIEVEMPVFIPYLLPPWNVLVTAILHCQLTTRSPMQLVPSPSNPSKPDWTYVQKAWWDAILHAYRYTATCPQRFPLEMRIMGDSNVLMAPQRGNGLGTCSIEILTLQTEKERWIAYAQGLLGVWMSYRDSERRYLNTRPHWAKEWAPFTVHGRPWREWLKEVSYRTEIESFKRILGRIGERDGWTLGEARERFSNELFDGLIFEDGAERVGAGLGEVEVVVGGNKVRFRVGRFGGGSANATGAL